MKLFFFSIILIFLSNCSFDNKSGIWNNDTISKNQKSIIFKDFKRLSSSNEEFNNVIQIKPTFKFKIKEPYRNVSWKDIFFDEHNNIKNLKYNDANKLLFKSKKITKHRANIKTLFEEDNHIINDERGNIVVYSISKKVKINNFNFYKNKYKKIEKKLNFIVENGIIYVSDNIGYVYAYDYKSSKVLWAKNFKIPFRSNIKLSSKILIAANQNNDLYILDKKTGNLIKLIPSEDSNINNQFTNSIVLGDEDIFFLNTYGSLYSIDQNNFKINWFINLNQSLNLNINNLFFGNDLVYHKNKILVSSNNNFYVFDSKTGSINIKKNFSSFLKPILNNDFVFLISKNNLMIAMDLQSGDIIYSYDLSEKVANFLNTKKKELIIKNFYMINNKIFIFLENSYLIQLDIKSEVDKIVKLPSTLGSTPIVVNNLLLYLNKKNNILLIN